MFVLLFTSKSNFIISLKECKSRLNVSKIGCFTVVLDLLSLSLKLLWLFEGMIVYRVILLIKVFLF